MRTIACVCCCLAVGLVASPAAHAGPAFGRCIRVVDGDTLEIVGTDADGKDQGTGQIWGIRGIAVPAIDQPFGRQAVDRLAELVAGKAVIWNGPVARVHPHPVVGRALHFRTAKGDSVAMTMIAEGLAWVVEGELTGKKPADQGPGKPLPEAIAQDEARQAKRGLWADEHPIPPWEWRDRGRQVGNSLGMTLLFIPPGTFAMGSPESEQGREHDEVPHTVTLTKGFYLGQHEVTVGQFRQFVADARYRTDGEKDGKGAYGIDEAGKIEAMEGRFTWKTPGFEQTDDHPVVDVSWQDAVAFCRWLGAKEGKTYRLPTEAEWEYACRAGTATPFAFGPHPEGLAKAGNVADATARARFPGWTIGIKAQDGHVFTAPVGQYGPNAFGLHDMHGNVWEWCADWYEPRGHDAADQADPTGPAAGTARVQRGGGWSSDAKRCRSASRVGRDPADYRGCYLGFRVVLDQSRAETIRAAANK